MGSVELAERFEVFIPLTPSLSPRRRAEVGRGGKLHLPWGRRERSGLAPLARGTGHFGWLHPRSDGGDSCAGEDPIQSLRGTTRLGGIPRGR